MRARIPYLLAALAWAGLISYLSSRTGAKTPPMPHPVDWIVHGCAFFGLGFLLALALGSPRRFWIAALLVSVYGGIDELHQWFVPGRSCDPTDWLADTLGGTSASIAWLLAWRQGRAASRK